MKYVGLVTLTCSLLAISVATGQTKSTRDRSAESGPAATTKANPDRGQQVFVQNCSRCHNAPEGFSPRISGTIARHMRVRASLSEADYKALREFLNP
jgi:Cytochrome c2